jgi:hypothetical protein
MEHPEIDRSSEPTTEDALIRPTSRRQALKRLAGGAIAGALVVSGCAGSAPTPVATSTPSPLWTPTPTPKTSRGETEDDD